MRRLAASLVCFLACAYPAQAQLALPGAVAPAAIGSTQALQPAKKARKARGVASGLAGVLGQPLALNGDAGVLLISKPAGDLQIDRLTLHGEAMSGAQTPCDISVIADAPIPVKSLGRPDGSDRFEAQIPACPFSFEVVGGAVIVPPATSACVFKAADCQASPAGLWGPSAATLEKAANAVERLRTRAELDVAANLKILVAPDNAKKKRRDASGGNDPSKTSQLARDQTRFASERDDQCRDYVGEARYGFCAASLTQQRAAYLHSLVAPEKSDPRKP